MNETDERYERTAPRRRRKRKRHPIRTLLILLAFVVVALRVCTALSARSDVPETPDFPWDTDEPVSQPTEQPTEPPVDKYLIVINEDNPLTEEDMPDYEIVSAYGVIPVLTSDVALERETLEAVSQLIRAAREAGIKNLLVNDGYRNREEQQRIYDAAEDKSLVQLPDCSEHRTGLAADIAARGIAGNLMGESEEGKWLADNAWKFGLILRYPEDKQDITGISYEPWHFRYIGLEAAQYIYANGLCLEEFEGI
ncbi:MAG: M15 family metallopeptidase [Oscillospiraceae bacterium]|nr:M15 family metallopeptidase [Oscillospiraceae bacterium]